MKKYIDMMMKIANETMCNGEYKTALQALQAIVKTKLMQEKNKKNNIQFNLNECDDETLAKILQYTEGC